MAGAWTRAFLWVRSRPETVYLPRGADVPVGFATMAEETPPEAVMTMGDTVNVTSRLQGLTRALDRWLVASAERVQAVEREAAEQALLGGLAPAGPRGLRGRGSPVEVWAA
jgi:hypothetical protein